jgi:hypothetical protein
MRIAILVSVGAHILFLLWGIISFAMLSALPTPSEPVAVDLVSQKEFTEALQADPDKPAPAPQPAAPQPPAQRAAPQEAPDPALMPTWWPQEWVTSDAAGAPANTPAVLSNEEVAALHAHLQKCWTPPAGVPAGHKLRVTLRVSLAPNGALTADPALIQASASQLGPAVFGAALRALRQCQPIAVLPAGKYEQWKVLDLTFTPQGLTNG